MLNFFQFLFRFRVFILFIILEGIGFWLMVNNNPYQGSVYFNSSNTVIATTLEYSNAINDFFELAEVNQKLLEENTRLKEQIFNRVDTISPLAPIEPLDSVETPKQLIELRPAKVINNSLFFQNNYLTINKGSNDGVLRGMGVIGADGVVGQIHTVSENYASVYSLLHASMLISSVHLKSNSLCTTKWAGSDPNYSNIDYLPRHVKISIGDTITTSGYNSIFPERTMVGIVEQVSIENNATFYDITIKNATDFYALSDVYLVKNLIKSEKDSLEINQQ